jgi:hypothetical protein
MVEPRFVVGFAEGRRIAELRERLGREIGLTKNEPLAGDGRGLLRVIGEPG